ncbi:MAG: hypothetical protein KME05_02860 [Gloeocapsa sp. UFS-A4-WI-NPMV-4B04]|jgi:hypothetical protein|nr:hypothetical protein [Gloeocapsa sp. UFS-A4-WI-NPMV-4B04]
MKKFAVIIGLRSSTNVIDGPGWTDVDVDSYYNSDGKCVPPQYRSRHTPEESVHTVTSK